MDNNNQVKLIAADVMTGTILDENLEWFVNKPGQKKWKHYFENRADAVAFSEQQVQIHPDVEYWLLDGHDKDGQRIVNQKWKR